MPELHLEMSQRECAAGTGGWQRRSVRTFLVAGGVGQRIKRGKDKSNYSAPAANARNLSFSGAVGV